jgi:hypothetical protein
MAATLLGAVGKWGIESDESTNGIIIKGIETTEKSKNAPIMNRVGERVGESNYDYSMEISIKGELTALTPFAQKLSNELVMANALTAPSLSTTGGKVYIREVQRSKENEGWQAVTVSAEMMPYFA